MTTPVIAAGLLSPAVIAGAILVIAVIVIIGVIFILRSGRKKDGAVGSSLPDWQRQSQVGEGGWNPQGANANNWQQGQMQQQQAGGWNASPNAQPNNWSSPNQQPSGNSWNSAPNPQQNGWSSPNQQPSGNSWNSAANSPQPQPVNAWDNNANMAQQQQPMNAWNSSNPAQQQQPANAWNQQQAQNSWAPAPPTGADQWGQQSAPSSPSAQSWGQQNASSPNQQPSPNSFSGNANPAWNNQQQQGYPAQGNPASIPSWQQNNYNPNSMGQGDPTMMAEDRTVLRAPGSAGVPGTLGYVRVEEGKEPGRIYEVRKESLSIGRSRESDIFLEDLAVSRLHASIVNLGNGNYALKDEGSANGTKVNGQVVNKFQTYPLQEGDQIQLGQTVLVFGRK
jgi:hypothetical protein